MQGITRTGSAVTSVHGVLEHGVRHLYSLGFIAVPSAVPELCSCALTAAPGCIDVQRRCRMDGTHVNQYCRRDID